jgi:hypothetical protein
MIILGFILVRFKTSNKNQNKRTQDIDSVMDSSGNIGY